MKKLIFIGLGWLFIPGLSKGQGKELTQFISNSLATHTSLMKGIRKDSCYHANMLLRIEINNKSRVTTIAISDNTEEWFKKEITKLKKKIDISTLDSLVRTEGLKNCFLVFPVFIAYSHSSCHQRLSPANRTISKKYFQFDGRNLGGNIFFGDTIEYMLFGATR